MLLDRIAQLTIRIDALEKSIDATSNEAETTRRLQTLPGVGPIGTLAVENFAPPIERFKRDRDFPAWLGLVPRQSSTGGEQWLGKTSKMGQRDGGGSMAAARWAPRRGAPEGSWPARITARTSRMLVAIAQAGTMARGIWATLTNQEDYRSAGLMGAA